MRLAMHKILSYISLKTHIFLDLNLKSWYKIFNIKERTFSKTKVNLLIKINFFSNFHLDCSTTLKYESFYPKKKTSHYYNRKGQCLSSQDLNIFFLSQERKNEHKTHVYLKYIWWWNKIKKTTHLDISNRTSEYIFLRFYFFYVLCSPPT